MSFGTQSLNRFRNSRSPRKPRSRRRAQLRLEMLEARCMLSANPLVPEPVTVEPATALPVAEAVAGELLVNFKENASDQQIQGLYRAHGLSELERLYGADQVRRVAVPQQAVEAVSRALQNNPLVDFAEPNYVAAALFTPNDSYYPYQWNLNNSAYGGIQVDRAWDTSTGDGAVVAVLDTGTAYENYSDGTGNYYVAPDLAGTNFVAGYDFINNDAHPNDDHSHGTHVTGTIAQSTNNARGTSGVAFDASVMPVKVLGRDGSGSYSAIANGIRWAADRGADVINMSLGASSPSQTLEDALAYAYGKGVTIVAAAGNNGMNAVSYPAAYDDYVIAVSASRYDEQIAYYSNYGSSIDIAAPGGDVTVDQNGDGYADGVLQNTFNPDTKDPSSFGYYFFQGTSMASPHVAGVAALIVSQGVTDPAQVREVLLASTEDKGPSGVDIYYGHGLLDASAALASVSSANTAPVAADDTAVTNENNAVTVDVLSNDADADGDPLSIVSVRQPASGSVVINADNTVTYTPGAGFSGTDSFEYTTSDGNGGSDTAVVAVTVNAVNDAPTAANDAISTAEDTAVVVDVLANDADADGDPLSIVSVRQPASGSVVINADNTLTYTPNPDFSGSDSFEYTTSDGNGGSDTAVVAVTVNAVNDAPTAANDAVSTAEGTAVVLDVLANDTDADGDPLSITWVTLPASGSLAMNADNTLTYAPKSGFSGSDSFTYMTSDGNGGSDTAVVDITVNAVNNAPTAANDAVSTAEGTAVVVDVLANDADADGDPLSVASVTQPASGSVVINADNTLTYTPDPGFSGSDSFAYTNSDGNGGSDTAVVDITVNAVNDAPTAANDAVSTAEGTAVVIDVLANDTDADGDPLSVASVTQPASGSVVINADNTLTYTPDPGFSGSDSFTYAASDGNGQVASATVTVDVQAPSHVHVGDLDATAQVKGKGGNWDAYVTATVHDANDQPVSGATVTGLWGGAAEGSVSGTTASDGTVTFAIGIKGGSQAMFTVQGVTSDSPYDPASNHDADGDSDGSLITVNKDETTAMQVGSSTTLGPQSTVSSSSESGVETFEAFATTSTSSDKYTKGSQQESLPPVSTSIGRFDPPPVGSAATAGDAAGDTAVDTAGAALEDSIGGLLEALIADGMI